MNVWLINDISWVTVYISLEAVATLFTFQHDNISAQRLSRRAYVIRVEICVLVQRQFRMVTYYSDKVTDVSLSQGHPRLFREPLGE